MILSRSFGLRHHRNISWIVDFMTRVRNEGVIIPREILTVYCSSKAVICTEAHNPWSVPWIKHESAKAWDLNAAIATKERLRLFNIGRGGFLT
ncbi:hypothetical protein QJS04_geneDACA022551 [Acorus gramineus]|uniref:Uncharacterized protein n=1 Tax=Acorus gramineus TaxID=55184 RepID=A0AAV9A9L7_ACOGR|nr:hypothetical protein QJS04_geneDACA022551 [Acorus gramineus]